jgi:hypothetical protein
MKPFTKIASLIFALIAIAHFTRLFIQFEVHIGSHVLPLWISFPGVIIAGAISFGLWKESK